MTKAPSEKKYCITEGKEKNYRNIEIEQVFTLKVDLATLMLTAHLYLISFFVLDQYLQELIRRYFKLLVRNLEATK